MLVMLTPRESNAQQEPMHTMYMWNTLAINPAYAGSREVFSTIAVGREQWTGFEGAPSTQNLSLHTPLLYPSVALGFTVINDNIGPTNNTGVWGDFAYRFNTTENAKLSLALRGGASLQTADLADVEGVDPDDPAFNKNVETSLVPNFGFGAYYYSDLGYVGLSIPRLLNNEENNGNNPGSINDAQDETQRHYYLTAGYVFSISADSTSLMFKPSVVARAVENGPVNFDVTANFLIKQKLWLGASYRHESSIAGLISFRFTDHLRAGYSYDFGTSELQSHHSGTHEIMIGYDFFQENVKTMSPRYF